MGRGTARARGELVDRGKRLSGWISHARNAAWAAGVLVAGSAGLLALRRWIPTPVVVAAVLVLVFALGMIAGGYLYRTVARRRDTDLGYRVLAASYEYSFDPDDLLEQTQRVVFEIEARRSNVSIVENRYSWTGEGRRPDIELEDSSHTLLVHEGMVFDRWQHYYVYFRTPLLKGERHNVVITQRMRDDDARFQPILSKFVSDYLGSLTLTVRIPASAWPGRNAFRGVERLAAAGDHRILRKRDLEVDEEYNFVKLVVPRPAKHHRYAIEWDWAYPQ